jgi:hypothetical protein
MQAMISESQKRELEQKAKEYAYDRLETREEKVYEKSSIRSKASAPKESKMRVNKKSKAESVSRTSAAGSMPISVEMSAPVPASSPAISQPPSQSSQPEPQPASERGKEEKEVIQPAEVDEDDYTLIPTELDRKFEILDEDSALRPTIIQPGQVWTKSSQAALLAAPTQATLYTADQENERNKAFDLLDALTRSGCLGIDQASLHVVMAATHCFDKTLIDTVIQDNVNPIEKVERSALIIATTIHNKSPAELIKPEQQERVSTYSPNLFGLPRPQLEYHPPLIKHDFVMKPIQFEKEPEKVHVPTKE